MINKTRNANKNNMNRGSVRTTKFVARNPSEAHRSKSGASGLDRKATRPCV